MHQIRFHLFFEIAWVVAVFYLCAMATVCSELDPGPDAPWYIELRVESGH